MVFDFSKIKARKKEVEPVDPIELFQKLQVTDQKINDLWLAQGDALRDWHANRNASDVGVVLNTGASFVIHPTPKVTSPSNPSLYDKLYVTVIALFAFIPKPLFS